MRILLVHNRYQYPGGEDEVVRAEAEMLRTQNHDVETYEAHNNAIKGSIARLTAALQCVWSSTNQRSFCETLHRFTPDLVHVHNFFPLISPAIHHTAHNRGIPVIQTLHNYRLLCPAATLLRAGSICEKCTQQPYPFSAVRHACYRDSHVASAAVANMLLLHRAIGTWTSTVSRFIALSEFARRKYISSGFPEDKICVKPNFLANDPGPGPGGGDFFLFVGRLSEEKGVACLLEAWKTLRSQAQLIIVGDGPLAAKVREAAQADRAIRWVGFLKSAEVLELMGRAFALVFPSIWFEGFPMVLAEALAKGLPVIASDLGSMPEIISHGRTGLLSAPGSPLDLAGAVHWALCHREEVNAMRLHAREEFLSKYTAEINYRLLMKIYEYALPVTEAAPLLSAI